ncbi:MAG: hypothetical protein ACLSE8_02850 [Parasutterella sp.]
MGFLPIARQLVTIKTDADLSAEVPSLESLKLKTPNRAELLDYYNKLEFRSWAKELKKTDVPGEVTPLETSTTAQREPRSEPRRLKAILWIYSLRNKNPK